MELDVLTVGEAMVLFAAQQPGPLDAVQSFSRSTAGADLNVAIGLCRLGLRVGYISRVGNDSFGRHIASALDLEGIDRRHVAVDAKRPTGFMLKSRALDGSDPQIEYYRAGSAASCLGVADNPRAYCASSRHLHLTGVCAAISESARELVFELAAEARAAGRSVSFDPNLRPRLWPSQQSMIDCLNRMASLSDWVMPGLEEGRLLAGRDSPQAVADFYLERGASRVIVKLGPRALLRQRRRTRLRAGVPGRQGRRHGRRRGWVRRGRRLWPARRPVTGWRDRTRQRHRRAGRAVSGRQRRAAGPCAVGCLHGTRALKNSTITIYKCPPPSPTSKSS